MLKRLRGLPRDVWLVGLISLVNDSASDLIDPLLPLYLTSVLLAGPKALGLIEGIAEATGNLLKLVSGAFSDRSGRIRPWIVTGYGMAGLARPLIALAASWPVVLMLRARQRGVPQAQIPLLWAAISAVAMVGATPLAAWSDRIGRRRLLVGGFGAYGVFDWLIGQLRSGSPWLLLVMASYGLFLAATEGVEKALVADLLAAGQRGTAFGWFNLITGLMVLPASALFGWLHEAFSPQVAFSDGGVCGLAAALWLSRLPLAMDPGLWDPGAPSSR